MQDLHQLPKLADSLSYLYAEHTIVDQKAKSIELFDKDGATLVPSAALTVLLLGPGTRITHAAVKALADCGCSIVWVGEDGTRCYAQGGGETRKARHLLHQARLASDEALRLEVCKRMYRMRFANANLDPDLTIQQLRGMEGARMRDAYAHAAITYDVTWHGRSYERGNWGNTDPVNRALSAANALLNGLCHAAIVSGGYSTALGFIHTGKQLSFVYDIADLYKTEITIPTAFRIAGASVKRVEARVRQACRQAFKEAHLLQRILPDINALLDVPQSVLAAGAEADEDPARPEPLWEPERVADTAALFHPPATPSEERAAAVEPEAGNNAQEESTLPRKPPSPLDEVERALRARRRRAEGGLRKGWRVRHVSDDTWHIVTRPGSDGYTVHKTDDGFTCTCPDFAKTGLGACKHTFAVEIGLEDGVIRNS